MSCETELRATRPVLPNFRNAIWVSRSSSATVRAFTVGWIGAFSILRHRVPMVIEPEDRDVDLPDLADKRNAESTPARGRGSPCPLPRMVTVVRRTRP